MVKSIIAVFLGLALSTSTANAQWEFGGLGGIAVYWGDLSSAFLPHRVGPSAALVVRRNFDGRMCLRFSGSYANIGANDKFSRVEYNKMRNLSFQTDIFEFSTLAEFNFMDFNGARNRENKKFTSYLAAGPTLFMFTPKAKYEDTWYKLRPLGTEGQKPGSEYSPVSFAIAVGGGFKAKINEGWSLNFEILHRILFTDFIDDVSGVYADKRVIEGFRGADGALAAALSDRSIETDLSPEPIGQPGRQRGDSKRKDSFMTIGIGLTYHFTRLECPAYK